MTKALTSANVKIGNNQKKGGSTMKQEWFESNDFVKTTSKNKPDEQFQNIADKTEETIADLDTPMKKILK